MESSDAIAALSALAHEGRLAVFRLLVRAGAAGLPAGEVSRRLDMRPNTLSANLGILARAGLVASRRHGRSIIYTAVFGRMAALMAYLADDCCQGVPAVCAPLADIVAKAACSAPASPGASS